MDSAQVKKTIATYNTIASQYASDIDVLAPESDRKLFLSYLKPRFIILDVGCAAGRDSIYFSQRGHTTVGVDLSEKLLAIARNKAPHLTFLHDDIRKDLFPNESFDAVWACAVLLHLGRNEVPVVLKKFYDMLKPKGMMYIMVKHGEGEADVAEKLSHNKSRHFTYFMPDELRQMVEGAGFVISNISTTNEHDRDPTLRDLRWISLLGQKL